MALRKRRRRRAIIAGFRAIPFPPPPSSNRKRERESLGGLSCNRQTDLIRGKNRDRKAKAKARGEREREREQTTFLPPTAVLLQKREGRGATHRTETHIILLCHFPEPRSTSQRSSSKPRSPFPVQFILLKEGREEFVFSPVL